MLASARGSYWVRIRQRRLRRRHLGLGGLARELLADQRASCLHCKFVGGPLSLLHVVLKNDTRRLDGPLLSKSTLEKLLDGYSAWLPDFSSTTARAIDFAGHKYPPN